MSELAVWAPQGALTFETATSSLDQARAVRPTCVDLMGVSEADSTALALLVALAREQAGRDRRLSIKAMPEGMAALADLYGVADLFDISASDE